MFGFVGFFFPDRTVEGETELLGEVRNGVNE